MSFKGRFPFRIGCTSYVIPDHILPNVEYMAEYVDDIELLFFESAHEDFLKREEVRELQKISKATGVTYSVHCPTDLSAGSCDSRTREAFANQIEMATRLSCLLNITGFIVHLGGLSENPDKLELANWENRAGSICKRVVDSVKVDPSMLCIENLSYNPDYNRAIVNKYGLSMCMDIGHLWKFDYNCQSFLEKNLDVVKIVHLHAVNKSKDHQSLLLHDTTAQIEETICKLLKTFKGVVTVELFDKKSTFESLEYISKLWEKFT